MVALYPSGFELSQGAGRAADVRLVRQYPMASCQGVVACQACAFVEPARSCLVTASPLKPSGGVAGWLWTAEGGGQALDLVDGERDQAGVCGRLVVQAGGRRGLGVGAFPQLGGGDRADREGGHDQHEVPQDRGVEPGLALVEAEAALSELEALLNRPLLIPLKRKLSLA